MASADAGPEQAAPWAISTSLLIDESAPAPTEDTAPAPEAGGSSDVELAKKLSNPVANLISVPFQFNYVEGYGPRDAGQLLLNFQPVVPISISEDFNMIVRTIVPIIYQESPAPGIDDTFALGDITQSFFFSPKKPIGGWILGAGPVAYWPTGTSPLLRAEQLGFGPTFVALRQQGGWTYGILANHIWAVTNSDDHPDLNATFLQPFLSYTFHTATSITVNTQSTYDWTGEDWTVQLNLQIAQMIRIGKLPAQIFVGPQYYPEAPDSGPNDEWGIRFGFTFLFPK